MYMIVRGTPLTAVDSVCCGPRFAYGGSVIICGQPPRGWKTFSINHDVHNSFCLLIFLGINCRRCSLCSLKDPCMIHRPPTTA